MSGRARTEQLSALLDGELPLAETVELTAHLASCPECVRRLAELSGPRTALAEAVPEEEVPAVFLARIAGALDDATAVSTAKNGAAKNGADTAQVIRFRPRVTPRFLGPHFISLAAVAAMLTLALLPWHDNTKDLMAVRDAALRGTVAVASASKTPAPVAGFRLAGAREDVMIPAIPPRLYAMIPARGRARGCNFRDPAELAKAADSGSRARARM